MIVIDSVGWIAFFSGNPLAAKYRQYLLNSAEIICPAIVLYEVTKKIELDYGRQHASIAAVQLLKTNVVAIDTTIAIDAARISISSKLPMGDAIIYSTTLQNNATLITSDAHFKNLPSVQFIPHPDKG